MIIVTGGAGFIGSALVWKLNAEGINDILIVDHMGTGPKWKNLAKRQFQTCIHKDDLWQWLANKPKSLKIDGIFHMGACSSTTERDVDYLMRNNVHYSAELFAYAASNGIPFIYASSAATYGSGEKGYSDDLTQIPHLKPINPYGFSKQIFDRWVLQQPSAPPLWMGFKFFNVYGPQEYHKGGQASVVWHAFPQVREKGTLKLFKSYRPDFKDGEQMRDFVYVKDVVDVMWHVFAQRSSATLKSGIYNLGSGKARTWIDLGRAVFSATKQKDVKFDFIEMPDTLRGQYQYFTEASLANMRQATGYLKPMTELEVGVRDYVENYLQKDDCYL